MSQTEEFPTSYEVGGVRVDPGVALAPMEGVTDVVFRRMIRALGGTGLTYSEFIASRGIVHGESRSWDMASFDPDERPVALQIFGRRPDWMAEAARRLEDAGATILDINMGCPAKKVVKKSGGSALMREPELARQIVREVRRAVSIPLTVKMRSGFDASCRNAPELARVFEGEGVDAITIHWRTRQDLYGGERAVDKIAEAVSAVSIPVVANGDIIDPESAKRMIRETGCAGVMVGRGAIRDPWAPLRIARSLAHLPEPVVDARERERVLGIYFDAIEAHFRVRSEKRTLGRMKMVARHLCDALPYGKPMRQRVVRSQTTSEVRDWLAQYFDALARYERGERDAFCGGPFDDETIARAATAA